MADAIKLDSIDPDEAEPEFLDSFWKTATDVYEPSAEQLYAAIDAGLAKNVEQERELRLLAWWKRNDLIRAGSRTAAPPMSEACRRNLEALIAILNDQPEDAVLKAESLRQLGQLERAKEILEKNAGGPFGWAASQILKFCNDGDTRVRPLRTPS